MSLVKRIGYTVLSVIFEWQVVRLRKRHTFTVVAVAGSLGKTSTKMALAKLLEHAGQRVRYQTGNYNVRLTIPLAVFGQPLPGLFNIPAWIKILYANEQSIRGTFPYDTVVVELGTDAPGQMKAFSYLHPDVGIITAIAPEHMEFFADLDAVATEEFALADYADKLVLNCDDIAEKYRTGREYVGYGIHADGEYRIRNEQSTEKGQTVAIQAKGKTDYIRADVAYLGEQGMKILVGAVAAADLLHVPKKQIAYALHQLQPFSGRMQRLHGIQDSIIIDDTYNAAPASVLAALTVLYGIAAPQRIVILGSMNELGDYSPEAHREVGAALNPEHINLVVTVGDDAKQYLAPVAAKNGCNVVSFASPYDAGSYAREHIQPGAVILAKGSQNRVFTEEALKPLLNNPEDAQKLVRQSSDWLRKKQSQFPDSYTE